MTKHTPAPWKVHNNIGKKSEIGIIADEAPCIICTMSNAKEWPNEAEANARLIAAAPELLDALKAIKGMCNMPEVRQAMMKHEQAYYHKTMNAARAAIQKAESE